MAETRSGIFFQQEFNYRRSTLRIAPDAYVVINGAYGARVVSPCFGSGKQTVDVRGGVTTMNISAAISPAGASRATLEVIAPQFKGLHEDYYITLPNGTKIPFFIPMQEIKIYMKGRFLESDYNDEPRYYPAFWGMITAVSENYSGGVFTFSLSCEDMLSWWKYQKITLRPSATNILFGGPTIDRFPTVFMNMSAWEIIYTLFMDNFFVQKYKHTDDKGNITELGEAYFNFIYPKLSSTNFLPEIGGADLKDTMGGIVRNIMNYWENRFGFNTAATTGDPSKIPLEMYGLTGPVKIERFRDLILNYTEHPHYTAESQTAEKAKLELDYNILASVQPFGSFSNWGSGAEPLTSTKLDIANTVCEQVNMEFFVDTNGHFVFKPPFYNLDVASGNVPHYRIGPEDIINFNANHDSNNIVNYLVVTGPMYQGPDQVEAIGFHIDFESIKRYGIRYDEISVRYGKTARILKLVACAEMSRRNGMAYTGSVSIPLRPEIRLGYPIYLEHIDTFYYVTGVNHSITFGQAATTDLSLQYRRERMFDDGSFQLTNSHLGAVLKGTVLAYQGNSAVDLSKSASADQPLDVAAFIDQQRGKGIPDDIIINQANEIKKAQAMTRAGVIDGPNTHGFYRIRRARAAANTDGLVNSGTPSAALFNELVMITGDTIPYTNLQGYRHIGAFPYGANLILMKGGQVINSTDPAQQTDASTNQQLNANPDASTTQVTQSSETSRTTAATQASFGVLASDENKELVKLQTSVVDWSSNMTDGTYNIQGPAKSDRDAAATNIQLGVPTTSASSSAKSVEQLPLSSKRSIGATRSF